MKRVLFAWELGSNLGHLSRDLPLAKKCLEAGHEVVWAVPDLAGFQATIGEEAVKLVQAPLLNAPAAPPRPPANYSEMLLHAGYGHPAVLQGSIRAWRSLMGLAGSDVMVFNHAPTALIAARTLSVPTYVTGTGFEVPPDTFPLPAFRRWSRPSQEALVDCDARLLVAINTALIANGTSPMSGLGDLFPGNGQTLTTFEELDPFGPRPHARYIGPVSSLPKRASVDWTTSGRPRVFAYSRPGLDGSEALLAALDALRGEVICFMPGVTAEWRTRFNKVRFFSEPVDIEELLTSADLAVTSGAGTIATALLAGVPVLVVPQVLEQKLAGQRLVALGAGLNAGDRRTASLFGAMLHQLLNRGEFKKHATEFAAKYRDHSLDQARSTQFKALQGLLGLATAP